MKTNGRSGKTGVSSQRMGFSRLLRRRRVPGDFLVLLVRMNCGWWLGCWGLLLIRMSRTLPNNLRRRLKLQHLILPNVLLLHLCFGSYFELRIMYSTKGFCVANMPTMSTIRGDTFILNTLPKSIIMTNSNPNLLRPFFYFRTSNSTWIRATPGRLRDIVAASNRKGKPKRDAILNSAGLAKKWIGNRGKVTHTGTRDDSFSTFQSGDHFQMRMVTLPMYHTARE